jgi:hypothetical protein
MPRGGIVSLVPSITESLLSWDVPVEACTRFCEQPGLLHVGGTKDPDLDAICDLAPTLVLMDREENRREDAEELRRRGIAVHATHVVGLVSLATQFDALARAVGVQVQPLSLPSPLQRWAAGVALIWRRPYMALGPATYGSDMLAHIGVANPVPAGSGRYPVLEGLPSNTDLVLLPSEPYPFAARHVSKVASELGQQVEAVLLDGQDLLWWGSRTVAAIERLAAATAALREGRSPA